MVGVEESAAVVLAGGRSRRMGRPKAWIEVGGQTLLARVVDRLRGSFRRVLVVGAPGQSLPETAAQRLDDRWPDRGPLGGLATAMAWCEESLSPAPAAYALVGCDMPFVHGPLLRAMLAELEPGRCVVPEAEAQLQPLHAVYSAQALPHLRDRLLSGQLGLISACRSLGCRVWTEALWKPHDPSGRCFLNVNSEGDLQALDLAHETGGR